MARAVLIAVVACGVAASPGGAAAQVVCVQAGSSTLQQADGGSLFIRDHGYEGSLGIGSLDPLRVGASLRTRYRGFDFSLGDQIVPFGLPTDVFSTGHSFLGRGFAIRHADDEVSLFALGGTTATGFATPYSFGARSDDAVGLVFLEGIVSPSLRVTTRTLYSGRMTSLFGADWTPRPDFRAGLTGGAGADRGYAAASARYERGPFTVRAAYALSGDEFRRVVIPRPDASEMDRENIEIAFRPRVGPALTASRNRYVQPSPGGATGSAVGSVNQFSASGTVRGFAANAALYLSEAPNAGGTGASFALGRGFGRLFRAQGSALYSDPRAGRPSVMWVGSLAEALSPRIELTQLVTRSPGTTTFGVGGNLLLDRVSVGAECQTIYLPFAARDAFRQALMLHARIQGPGGIQANLGSYVGPDGRVRYTAYATQYLYGGARGPREEIPLYTNLIRGKVQTANGAAVPGAALRIGKETVFTDSRGEFFLRVKKRREMPFEVALGEFIMPGRYSVVSAPGTVEPEPEERAGEVVVVLERY